MKVRELIEVLKDVDPDIEVIMQKDAEGNGYSPLVGCYDKGIFHAHNSWDGEFYDSTWTAEDVGIHPKEWEEFLKRPRCLLLYPMN